jgi:hypothetical protein
MTISPPPGMTCQHVLATAGFLCSGLGKKGPTGSASDPTLLQLGFCCVAAEGVQVGFSVELGGSLVLGHGCRAHADCMIPLATESRGSLSGDESAVSAVKQAAATAQRRQKLQVEAARKAAAQEEQRRLEAAERAAAAAAAELLAEEEEQSAQAKAAAKAKAEKVGVLLTAEIVFLSMHHAARHVVVGYACRPAARSCSSRRQQRPGRRSKGSG